MICASSLCIRCTRPRRFPKGRVPTVWTESPKAGTSSSPFRSPPGEDVHGNRYFLFTIPIEDDWEDSLERLTLTGPEGEVTVDDSDPRSLTVVTDPATGRIRAILRDWVGPLPAVLGDTGGLEVESTRGIVEAVRLRR